MKNELQIKPLLKYDVVFRRYNGPGEVDETETFTAESYEVTTTGGTRPRIRFYRTGNVIREYFETPEKIIVTPVDNVEG